jgi:SAM-dependent methyltransferase
MTPARDVGVARFWDARARRYDAHYDASGPDGYTLRARRDLVVTLLGRGPGDALDAGMGAGRLCESLDARGWRVSGIDASSEMVSLARARLPEAAERLTHSSIEQLPFDSGSFDAVAATGVLEYTDVARSLGEVARVLRPGGRAVVSYPNPRALYALWKTGVWYRILEMARGRARSPAAKPAPSLTPERFARLLAGAGLRFRSTHYTGYLVLPSPLDELLPSATAALGARLEGASPAVGRVLATQVVYVAERLPVAVNGAEPRGGRTG